MIQPDHAWILARALARVNRLRQSLNGYYCVKHWNLRFLLGMEKIRKDRHQSHTSRDIITSRTTSPWTLTRIDWDRAWLITMMLGTTIYYTYYKWKRVAMIVACTQTLFYFSFRKHRRARVLLPPPPYAGGSINPPAVLFFVTRTQRTLKRK